MKRRDFLAASAGFAGFVLPGLGRAQSQPCPPPTLAAQGGPSASTSCAALTAEADFSARIGGPGVVWYHDFRTDAEVNNFRWTNGYVGGNDPLAKGGNGSHVRRITTDGITGGGCLEIYHPAGEAGNSVWWRPFSPITGSGNGRGVNDPGANGSIAPQAYSPSDGGSQISAWGSRGFYGHPKNQTGGPSASWDGTEYYLQVRVKISGSRVQSTPSARWGKLFYFTRTDASATAQEIVTHSGVIYNGRNYFGMYRSVSPPLESDTPGTGNNPGTTYGGVGNGYCYWDNTNGLRENCWFWPPDQWVTVLYQIAPGVTEDKNTIVRVWVANQGQTSYTKIWDQTTVALPYGVDKPWGHNALICSIYQNGYSFAQAFYHRYDQIIFSKQFIPCPQV
jgi:hypothetical protein